MHQFPPIRIADRVRIYTEFLISLGYEVDVSSTIRILSEGDCEYSGRYYANGSHLCIKGSCHKCDSGTWRNSGKPCTPDGSTICQI